MNEKRITVDEKRCKREGLCATVCPMKIFVHEKGEAPVLQGTSHCVLCGQCIAVCPGGAITHSVLPPDKFEKIVKRSPQPDDTFFETLQQRRSVRTYLDREIPREELEAVVRCCGYAPTGAHGGRGWERNVTVVTGKQNLKAVLEHTVAYMKLLEKRLSSLVLPIVSRWIPEARGGLSTLPDLRLRLALHEKGEDPILYGAPALVLVHAPRDTPTPQMDCDAALYAMMLAAHSRGLGTCWMGWVQFAARGFQVRSFSALKDFLRIPDENWVYAAMTVGFPAVRLHSLPYRVTNCTWIT